MPAQRAQMQALRFAASGRRASSASPNSAPRHQHAEPGDALSITQAFGAPQIGQSDGLSGVRVDFH